MLKEIYPQLDLQECTKVNTTQSRIERIPVLIQCKCSYGMIATMTLNPTQHIVYNRSKRIAVTIALCELT